MAIAILLASFLLLFFLFGVLVDKISPKRKPSSLVNYGIEEDGTGNSDVGG